MKERIVIINEINQQIKYKENGWKQMDVVFTMSNSKRPGNNGGTETSSPKKTEEVTYVFVKA